MEILFKDAIRLVHPDSNKNIIDAGEKVKTVMMYKNEPKMLYTCLRKWGLVPDQNGNFTKEEKKKTLIREMLSHLLPNHNYEGSFVFVHHKKLHGTFGVRRTTDKRVYFTKATTGRTGKKYCDINSVKFAYIVKEQV